MGVELRERKWCGMLGIEKVGIEGYWKKKKPLQMVLHLVYFFLYYYIFIFTFA